MNSETAGLSMKEFVTATIGGQLFGLPIQRVQDVFVPERLTKVPLAPPEIAGVLNLRGRIVTLIDMRCRLGLEPRDVEAPVMAIGVEWNGEFFGLLIDDIGEVLKLDGAGLESNPINLDPLLAAASHGIYRLEDRLLIVLDVERILDLGIKVAA